MLKAVHRFPSPCKFGWVSFKGMEIFSLNLLSVHIEFAFGN